MRAFQLEQVFQNLIQNAVRYHSEPPPIVEITARRQGAEWLFAVRDNGIGIAPEYHEKIFAVFNRLHSQDEYPETGMGLAICRRCMERAGGQMWVESA
jgi:light-regulated signal transduction histidine kinase (bacteriophytochrome)